MKCCYCENFNTPRTLKALDDGKTFHAPGVPEIILRMPLLPK